MQFSLQSHSLYVFLKLFDFVDLIFQLGFRIFYFFQGKLLVFHLNVYNIMQNRKAVFNQLRYRLTAFRTKKTYLLFQISQLLLSVVIVVVALTSKRHFRTTSVFILEVILFATMAFDLLVVRWVSERAFWSKKMNIFDLIVLIVFAVTLVFLGIYDARGDENEQKDARVFIETDDILIIVVVIVRYVAQLSRLGCMIKDARTNREIHQEIKKINLNEVDINQSFNFKEMIDADKLFREKITNAKKHVLNEESDDNDGSAKRAIDFQAQ